MPEAPHQVNPAVPPMLSEVILKALWWDPYAGPRNEDAQRYVEDRLRSMGVIRALESAGFEPGDDVEIAGMMFELDPGAPFGS